MKRNASKKKQTKTKANVTIATVGRNTDQSFGVCKVNFATPNVATKNKAMEILRVIALHHLPHLIHDAVRLHQIFFPRLYVLSEFPAHLSFSFRSSGVRFFQNLLHFFEKCSSLVFIFSEFLCISLSTLLSLSSCLSFIAAISIILSKSDSLLTLSLQLLFQVCVFSFKVDPNASISREISFHFSRCSSFSTCHVSFVQQPHRLATASVVWIWNTNLSLTILHAWRSWLSSVSHCFSSLLTLPPFWERSRKTQ